MKNEAQTHLLCVRTFGLPPSLSLLNFILLGPTGTPLVLQSPAALGYGSCDPPGL